jgi:hypothetical protein
METFHPTGRMIDKSVHGFDGPLQVSDGGFRTPKVESDLLRAAESLGYAATEDMYDFQSVNVFSALHRWVSPDGSKCETFALKLSLPLCIWNCAMLTTSLRRTPGRLTQIPASSAPRRQTSQPPRPRRSRGSSSSLRRRQTSHRPRVPTQHEDCTRNRIPLQSRRSEKNGRRLLRRPRNPPSSRKIRHRKKGASRQTKHPRHLRSPRCRRKLPRSPANRDAI